MKKKCGAGRNLVNEADSFWAEPCPLEAHDVLHVENPGTEDAIVGLCRAHILALDRLLHPQDDSEMKWH